MRKFTTQQKINGELAVRKLSLEAQMFYEASAPFNVYEVKITENANDPMGIIGTITHNEYYVDGFGDLVGPLSFSDLNWWLTDEYYTNEMDNITESMQWENMKHLCKEEE